MWKLKDEETARLFTHEMAARNDEVTKADDIQKKWLLMKETWLEGSKQVCGMTKKVHHDTRRFTADLQTESGRKNCLRIARQMAREGIDVISTAV